MSNELIKKAYEDFNGTWPYGESGGMACDGEVYAPVIKSDWVNTPWWQWVGTKADFEAYGESLKEEWRPEIGRECELRNDQDYGISYGKDAIGKKVTIESLFICDCGSVPMAAISYFGNCYCFRQDMLHPIKTESEKQEERNRDILEAINYIGEWDVKGETLECAVNSAFGEGMWGDIKRAVELGLVKPKGCEKQTDAMFDIVKDATDLYHACELLHDAGWRSSKSIGSSIFNACRDNYSSNYWREISASVYKDLGLNSEAEKVLK